MEITTKMASPSSRTSVKTIIFKLIIIGILLYILIHNPTLSPSLECSEEEGREECKVEVEAEVKANYDTIVTFMDTMNMDNILISINYFVNEKLPRYVASALLIHVGICCGYVGLVHMQMISPD